MSLRSRLLPPTFKPLQPDEVLKKVSFNFVCWHDVLRLLPQATRVAIDCEFVEVEKEETQRTPDRASIMMNV